MTAGLLALLMLMTRYWPDLPTSRWLHRTFVTWPLEMIEQIERRHIIFLVIGLFAMQGFAMVMTTDMAFLAALDLATYFDVAITAWTVAAITRMKGQWSVFAGRLCGPFQRRKAQRARRRRCRGQKTMLPPVNDDEPGDGLLLAA